MRSLTSAGSRVTFQPTLPARGATLSRSLCVEPCIISTHAPRTGSDLSISRDTDMSSHFNPRSPHGERHACSLFFPSLAYFNPRSPHGERRKPQRTLRVTLRISIHAPRTGSDGFVQDVRKIIAISIHAPRTGSDVLTGRVFQHRLKFQSTLPARGATFYQLLIPSAGIFQSTLPARGATGRACML